MIIILKLLLFLWMSARGVRQQEDSLRNNFYIIIAFTRTFSRDAFKHFNRSIELPKVTDARKFYNVLKIFYDISKLSLQQRNINRLVCQAVKA